MLAAVAARIVSGVGVFAVYRQQWLLAQRMVFGELPWAGSGGCLHCEWRRMDSKLNSLNIVSVLPMVQVSPVGPCLVACH